MSSAFVPYVIRNGEYFAQIAHRLGFDSDTVWNHDKNRAIREQRKGKDNLLCAGDVVFVPSTKTPGLPFTKRTTNRFVANVPTTTFDLHFDGDDGPLANAQFNYTIEGVQQQGTTDGAGKATFTLPITSTDVHVVFPDKGIQVTAKVGHLDPIEEPSGVWQRLKSRGYVGGDPSGNEAADAKTLAGGILAFQNDEKLPATGKMDDATVAKLTEIFKS